MRALVTGVAGFAGRHLARHLLASGDEVLGTTRDGAWPGRPLTAAAGDELSVPVCAWDLRREVPAALRDTWSAFAPEVIYHLAAKSVPDECGDPEPAADAVRVNVSAVAELAELATCLPGPPRLVFTSSSHVYATPPAGAPRVDEHAPLGPRRGYGKTKFAAEQLLLRAAHRGLPVVVARAFGHAGPGQRPPLMLAQWCAQLAAGGGLKIHTADAWIDLCDVRDMVRAYRLLGNFGSAGVVYNIGSGHSLRTGELAAELSRLAGTGGAFVESRPGFKQDPVAVCDRLCEATGWQAEIPWTTTLADTWVDAVKNH